MEGVQYLSIYLAKAGSDMEDVLDFFRITENKQDRRVKKQWGRIENKILLGFSELIEVSALKDDCIH